MIKVHARHKDLICCWSVWMWSLTEKELKDILSFTIQRSNEGVVLTPTELSGQLQSCPNPDHPILQVNELLGESRDHKNIMLRWRVSIPQIRNEAKLRNFQAYVRKIDEDEARRLLDISNIPKYKFNSNEINPTLVSSKTITPRPMKPPSGIVTGINNCL